jgi:hypothetical protein
MAKVIEQKIVLKVLKLVKDESSDILDILGEDVVVMLVDALEDLDDGIVVEIVNE